MGKGLLFFTPWQSQTSSEQQEKKQQGQNGQRVKMGFCYLPPEKAKWAAVVYPLTESN